MIDLFIHLKIECSSGDIRLFEGHNAEQEVTVEVCLEGVWYSVCDIGWYSDDARVACRHLGFVAQGN